jgi:glyoxylase-like metal-dependent hydrolase (beta-lactamase superfamily II)
MKLNNANNTGMECSMHSNRKAPALGLFSLAAAFACGAALAAEPAAPAAPPATEIVPYHVAGNVWLMTGEPSNVVVQVGEEGVLVVDTGIKPLAGQLLAAIKKLAGTKPIRYVINTHLHGDHTGGNQVIREAGDTILDGNVARDRGNIASGATVIAHENVMIHMTEPDAKGPGGFKFDREQWPSETHLESIYSIYFNGEAVQMFHPKNAHTDGDYWVTFRRSDVVATGDLYFTNTYPVIDTANGGNINGVLAAVNDIIDFAVPEHQQEGGTLVIPGHGRIGDQSDLVEYRDMLTIIRDRVAVLVKAGKTLEQVKAAKPSSDYDGRFGAGTGMTSTDRFIEAVYNSLKPAPKGKK